MAVDSVTSGSVLDIESTLARFGGDRELFLEMAGILLEDTPRLFAELGDAVGSKDGGAIRSRAHALKGLLAGCGGMRAARVAQSLEDAGQAAELDKVDSLLRTLDSEIDQLTRALHQYRIG